MSTITSTEVGATGRYINLGSDASQDSAGAQTIIVYAKPANQTTLGYMFAKGSSTGVGPRFLVTASEQLALGMGSNTTLTTPDKASTSSLTLSTWQHLQGTFDDTLNSSGINLYVDAGAAMSGSGTNGTGTLVDDAANNVFLMNRSTVDREYVGEWAYIARWNRVLSDAERTSVRDNGPLSVTSGLLFCFANDQDYGPYALTVVARSTRVTGSLPPNTALGDATPTVVAPAAGHIIFAGNVPGITTAGATVAPAAGHVIFAGNVPTVTAGGAITLDASYERSSADLSLSIVSGLGDAAIVSVMPKMQEWEGSAVTEWMEPSVDVLGVNGYRPTFRFLSYLGGANGTNHGTNAGYTARGWNTGRKAMYSYDAGATWQYFSTAATLDDANQWIEFRHATAFTQDTVRISRSRQSTVHQAGDWLAALAAAHSFCVPSASAAAYTPTGSVAGYAAQTFIADEFSAQTDSLGAAIAITPFYAAEINDTSLTPASGNPKRIAAVATGEHAGEDHGDLVMRSFVNWLCGATAQAQALRREYRIMLYPCMNAPGRAGGGWRGSFTQGLTGFDDPNRHVNQTDTLLEVIDKPKAAMNTDRGSAIYDWYIDFHGTFVYAWSGEYNTGDAYHTRFRSLLDTNSGYTHADEGDDSTGLWSHYWRSLGARLSLINETGDPTAITDTQIADYGGAVGLSLATMVAEGMFFVEPAAGHMVFAGGVPVVSADGATYTLTADSASLTLAGQDAALIAARRLVADSFALTLAGQDATLTYTPASGATYTLSAASSSLTLAGQDAALISGRRLVADSAAFTLAVQDAILARGYVMAAASGDFSLIGQDAALIASRRLAADSSALTLAGQNVALTYSGEIGLPAGAINFSLFADALAFGVNDTAVRFTLSADAMTLGIATELFDFGVEP